jgi:hypothetical protein
VQAVAKPLKKTERTDAVLAAHPRAEVRQVYTGQAAPLQRVVVEIVKGEEEKEGEGRQ